MLHADRQSQPVSQCCAIQNPVPSHATVAAVDQQGRTLFLAPELESYSPERNMYTAVRYNLGQAPAGIVQGHLGSTPEEDDEGASGYSPSPSSLHRAAHQDSSCMPSSSSLPAGVDPRRVQQGAVGSGRWFEVLHQQIDAAPVDPPQASGRPQGM